MRFIFYLLPLLICLSCKEASSLRETAIQDVTELVELQRQATESGDVDFLMSFYPEQINIVENGSYFSPDKQKIYEIRKRYFSERTYTIENLMKPIVDASNDGKNAWVVTKIEMKSFDVETGDHLETTRTSALIVFSKKDDGWFLSAVSETYQ